MKVWLTDFCGGCSEENIASTAQQVLPLNLFPELATLCKDLTIAAGLVNISLFLEPCRASI